MKNKAFTLIELLVVVLIIGILAAIAVPQYQKAVMKSQFHTGMPIVESLYQAQQAYYLSHGNFATDIDDLDLSIPKNCKKRDSVAGSTDSKYDCSWGVIGIGSGSNIHYIDPQQNLLYVHYYADYPFGEITFEAGKRYCFAKGTSQAALDICQSFGGEQMSSHETSWNRYKIP